MNTNQLLNNIRRNPQMMQNQMVQNVFSMLDKKDHDGLMSMLNNTCNSRGVNPQEYLNRFKK